MATVFGNTQITYTGTKGIREDLISLIYNIDPTETPFLSTVSRGSAAQEKHEWQMDRLKAAGNNRREQGHKVVSVDALIPTERLANQAQISDKHISITGTLEVVNKAGRFSELSYQLAKRAKELKRDMEFTCVGQATASDMASLPAASGVPGQAAAVQAQFHANWVQGGTALAGSNINRGTGGADGGWDGSVFDAPTDSSGANQRALLESMLKGVIQGAWTNGGDPSLILTGPHNKTVISGFTGNSTRFDRGEDKRLVASVDVYVSDYGDHRIVPNRFQRDRDVLVLTPELYKVVYLRPFRQHALAKVGDSEDRTLLVEWTLELNNNAGSGIIADLTTS